MHTGISTVTQSDGCLFCKRLGWSLWSVSPKETSCQSIFISHKLIFLICKQQLISVHEIEVFVFKRALTKPKSYLRISTALYCAERPVVEFNLMF